jgi:hypothetical protein
MHLKLRLSAAKSLGVRESDWAILVTGPPANLVFLAKFEHRPAQTSWLEVPLIQIYYVKYLAQSLVWPSRFHEPPVVTRGRYKRAPPPNTGLGTRPQAPQLPLTNYALVQLPNISVPLPIIL